MHPLVEAYCARLTVDVRAQLGEPGDLADRLAAAVERGRKAWPDIAVAPDVFVAHLADKLGVETSRIGELAIEDLWLACALVHGDAAAMRVLEREYIPQIATVLVRRGVGTDNVDDVTQALREHLLVGTATRGGRIADYGGRGPLRGWIVVAAVRMSDRAGQRARRDAVLPLASVADPRQAGVDSVLARGEYSAEMNAACERVLVELPQRERALLRLQLVDGASIDQIGRIYGVHRATAARWLARARSMILENTRARLAQELGLDTEAAAGIADLVSSRLDVSVARLLQTQST